MTSPNTNFRIDGQDNLVAIRTGSAGAEAGGAITYPMSGTPLTAIETQEIA